MKYLFLKRKGLLSLVLNKQEIVQDKLSGVGFKSTKDMAKDLPPIRNNTTLILEEFKGMLKPLRNESKESIVEISEDNKRAKITITDSKEAWVSSLMEYFKLLTNSEYDSIETITINFDNIRPKGERLKTFGGFASGYEPMRDMFEGVDKTIKNILDEGLAPLEKSSKGKGYVHLRPIHMLDIGNLIANNVVSGGVRRSAEIFLFDADDYESTLAKYGINGLWTEEQLAQHKELGKVLEKKGVKPSWFDGLGIGKIRGNGNLGHRNMSNNSVAFTTKPKREDLNLLFQLMQLDGEPKQSWAL